MNKPTQRELDEFVNKHVFRNQSMLVDTLINEGFINPEQIENEFPPITDEDIDEYLKEAEIDKDFGDDIREYAREQVAQEQEPSEIYEWWLVSDWLLKKLYDLGEPVLNIDSESWWGRTTTGQAISLDYVIEQIYKTL